MLGNLRLATCWDTRLVTHAARSDGTRAAFSGDLEARLAASWTSPPATHSSPDYFYNKSVNIVIECAEKYFA